MSPLWRGWISILAVATVLATAALVLDSRARALFSEKLKPDEITLTAARLLQGSLLWIDARHGSDYTADHIPGALPLDLDNWDTQIAEVIGHWQPGMQVVVYCDDSACGSSRQVVQRLRRDYEFDNVWLLHGGWSAWQKAVGK